MSSFLQKKSVGILIGAFCLIGTYFFLFHHMSDIAEAEPDRYYHLALARITANEGFIRKLPQVVGLEWDKSFPEKNFLFTALTGVAYRLGGETLTLSLVPILAVCLLIGLLVICSDMVSPVFVTGAILLGLLFTPDFTNRLVLLRPHLLAISMFLVLLTGILRERPWLAAIGAGLFSLSYHAVYVPLTLLCIAVFFVKGSPPSWKKTVLAAMAGLILGLVLNPYFPLNLKMGLTGFKIALNYEKLSPLERPTEMVSFTSDEFLRRFGFHLSILGLGIWQLLPFSGKRRSDDDIRMPGQRNFLFVFILAIVFWGLTALNRRALEYAAPLTIVLFALILSQVKNRRIYFECALLAYFVLQGPIAIPCYLEKPKAPRDTRLILEAVDHLPETSSGKMVFNCDWALAPFLLYKRPDLKFIDLSDPTLLMEAAPEDYSLRKKLKEGKVPFPYGVIRNHFHADYVFCGPRKLVDQMESDPHFQRLYPIDLRQEQFKRATFPFVYKIADSPISNLAFDYEFSSFENAEREDIFSLLPARAGQWRPLPFQNAPYLDFSSVLESPMFPTYKRGPFICSRIRPSASTLKGHLNATLLGVGGGKYIRLWWNGTALLSSSGGNEEASFLRTFVQLPHPLKPTDKIEALVCSKQNANYMGFSLSFWKPTEISAICNQKGTSDAASVIPNGRFSDFPSSNCLGPLAFQDTNY